jgi:hypothetical protein
MEKNSFRQLFILVMLGFVLMQCEVSEKSETKSGTATDFKGDKPIEVLSSVSDELAFSYVEPKNLFSEAILVQESPLSNTLLPPGDVDFKFKTTNFPLLDGHSIRLAIENGTQKFVFQAEEKVHLPKGQFICAAYLCDGNGICLKHPEALSLSQLNIGVDNQASIDLSQPMIFLNLPTYRETSSALVDFMLLNIDLAQNNDMVKLTIDNQTEVFLREWKPVKITGLTAGKHEVLVELMTNNERLYDSFYASDKLEFEIPLDNQKLDVR